MNKLLQLARQIQPDQLKQMLYQNGKINKDQFDAIRDMNSFEDIGQYLINNNVIPADLQNKVKSMFR